MSTPIVHAVMYRDYKIGTICDSGAWGPPMLFSAVTDNVTCPGCRHKIDGTTSRPIDLVELLTAQRQWSTETFGPGFRLHGVLDHIRKELREIEADPTDVTEWIDVVILALDGAWRAGHEPADIAAALVAKYAKNRARKWPDWRTADPNAAIQHIAEEAS